MFQSGLPEEMEVWVWTLNLNCISVALLVLPLVGGLLIYLLLLLLFLDFVKSVAWGTAENKYTVNFRVHICLVMEP